VRCQHCLAVAGVVAASFPIHLSPGQHTVPHSAIASAYDTLAEHWLDDRFNPGDGLRQHRHALGFLARATPAWALNVGCGCNTRFNALFREHGLDIEGVDLSDRMVQLARAADPSTEVHLADICTWQAPRRYRFISAWDSIWHVELDQQHALMLKLMDRLEPGGVLIFSAGGFMRRANTATRRWGRPSTTARSVSRDSCGSSRKPAACFATSSSTSGRNPIWS
jgi:2-polyprenyl-3-methyl-5-hydroxy-6-metoxy-1,4-benzoquinol methylase